MARATRLRSTARRAGLLLGVLLLVCGGLAAQAPVPALHARITDLTATFSADQTRALDEELAALEQRRGAQLAVLMIATLAPADASSQPDTIEQFATRVFDAWKLGRKGVDDGVLLIVVKDDRKVRIEVGYGLEGTIPDVIAARIIREYIAPKFRDDDYYGGVQAATRALAQLIDGGALPEPLEAPRAAAPASSDSGSLLGALFATVFASLLLGFLFACVMRSVFNIFPVQVLPVGARRVCGMLAAPLIIAALYVWAATQGDRVPLEASALAPPLLAAAITGRIGWSTAAGGASRNWFGGLTWSELFTALFEAIFLGVLGVVFGSLVEGVAGSSGSRGYSGGGGRSGGGGASGRW